MDEAEMYQSNLLKNFVEVNDKSRARTTVGNEEKG